MKLATTSIAAVWVAAFLAEAGAQNRNRNRENTKRKRSTTVKPVEMKMSGFKFKGCGPKGKPLCAPCAYNDLSAYNGVNK